MQLSVKSNHNCMFVVHEYCPTEKTTCTMLEGTGAENFDELAVVVEVISVCLVRIHTGGAETELVYMDISDQVIETATSKSPNTLT